MRRRSAELMGGAGMNPDKGPDAKPDNEPGEKLDV
jgi:hypothetical protein